MSLELISQPWRRARAACVAPLVLTMAVGVACRGSEPPAPPDQRPPASAPPSAPPEHAPAPATSAPAGSPTTAPDPTVTPPSGTPGPTAAPPATSPTTPPPERTAPARTTAPGAAGLDSPAAAVPAPADHAAPRPSAPEPREIAVPEGTALHIVLSNRVASNESRVEDPVEGELTRPVVVAGTTVLPAGSVLTGTVTSVQGSGRVKGRASVAFRFDRIRVRGERLTVALATIRREAAPSTRQDITRGGIGAGIGAVIGGIAGGGKGAAIGAGVGGAGTVLATKGKEIVLPTGTAVTARLTRELRVVVP